MLETKLREKGLAESSVTLYIKRLVGLAGGPFTGLVFVKDTPRILDILSKYAPTTQQSYLGMLVSILSLFPPYKKTLDIYSREFSARKREPKQEGKTSKQEANWMEWKEIKDIQSNLVSEILKYKNPSPYQFEKIMSAVVLSLYTELPPRRNADYLSMVVSTTPLEGKNVCLMEGDTPIAFEFGVYKTAKTYGTQHLDIPPSLQTILKFYFLQTHPSDGSPFLVKHDASPLVAVNSITRILNGVLQKNIGSTMLRHIFLSDKYGNLKEEMASDAAAMGHSVSTQQNVYNLGE